MLKVLLVLLALIGLFSIRDKFFGNPNQKEAFEEAVDEAYEKGYKDGLDYRDYDDSYEKGFDDGYSRAQENVDLWFDKNNWYYDYILGKGFSQGYQFCLDEYGIVEITPAPTSRPKSPAPSGGNRPAITAAPTTPAPTFFYPGFPALRKK